MNFCPKCGKELKEGQNVCDSCGAQTQGQVNVNITNNVNAGGRVSITNRSIVTCILLSIFTWFFPKLVE